MFYICTIIAESTITSIKASGSEASTKSHVVDSSDEEEGEEPKMPGSKDLDQESVVEVPSTSTPRTLSSGMYF